MIKNKTTRKKFLQQSITAAAGMTFVPSMLLASEQEKLPKYNLPYKNTYAKEPLVTDNEFRNAEAVLTPKPTYEQAVKVLPNPIWDNHQEEIDMYWAAWKIGVGNITDPLPDSKFINTYIDTAYNGNIFMWDTAFITMFTRYGERLFPFQQTIDNFYSHQHPDGFICREIKADGADCFERYDPTSTGPNLLPMSEMLYYKQTGDLDRLHKIFAPLSAYYMWLKKNHTWRDGSYWTSGWGSGMDNMPRIKSTYNPIYSHGHMVWVDATLQQIMTANDLMSIGFFTERWQEIEQLEDEMVKLKKYVREKLWDDETAFIYDLYDDDTKCPTMGIGAYWALHTDVLDKDQLDRFVAHLKDPETFYRPGVIPSIAANTPKYNPKGRYWQGGVWPNTNYMVLTGLRKQGYEELAFELAVKHYKHIHEVFKKEGTFFEYYSPESMEEGFLARKNFVGWTGLPPIAVFIEFILGISSSYVDGQVTWNINQTDRHGIERYPFGKDGSLSLVCKKRALASAAVEVEVTSDESFTLTLVNGATTKDFAVTPGSHTFRM